MREAINYYARKYEGDWSKIASAIKNDEEFTIIDSLFNYVTITDENYPAVFSKLRFPPWIIYYCGDLSLCNNHSIGVVGSREASAYGKEVTRKIVSNHLDHVIVSGLAKGIDEIAHKTAINHKTIGVIGCGLNVIYPLSNKYLYERMYKTQLIISEYPENVSPKKHHFPWRNRLIAALSDKLLVPQAKIKSGTLTTVNHAMDLGKTVYAVPHSIFDETGEGCNFIIANGAIPIINIDDKL